MFWIIKYYFLILEPYICLQCGCQYKTKTGIKYHIRVECGKSPEFYS